MASLHNQYTIPGGVRQVPSGDIGPAAIRLREEFGWCVLPAHRRLPPNQWHTEPWCSCSARGACAMVGKHPLMKWNEQDVPGPLPVGELAACWQRNSGWNVSLLLGYRSGGLVLADVDPRHGGSLDTLWRMGWSPQTCMEQTGGGGWHVYAQAPAGIERLATRHDYAPGIELLAEGGHAIIAPSMHKNGKRYEWLPGHAPWEQPPAPLPGAALAVVLACRPERHAGDAEPCDRDDSGALVYSLGETRRIATALYRKGLRKVRESDESRNITAFWLGRQLDSLGMTRLEVVEWVVAFGKEVEHGRSSI